MQCFVYKNFKYSTIKSGIFLNIALIFTYFRGYVWRRIVKIVQLFTKNYNFVCKKYVKSTSLLPVLFLTIQPHLCYSLIEIKLDNAKWQAVKLVLLVCSEPKFKSKWLHFMGVEKSFSMSFLIPNFRKKELRKCKH